MAADINRRALIGVAALAALSGAPTTGSVLGRHTLETRPLVVCLVHPNLVLQDLIGPLTVFTLAGCRAELVWKTAEPCSTDVGLPVMPTRTFEDCPRDMDVLLAPGGIDGSTACMDDLAVMSFLADRGSRAGWVTSVCTGALTIAAAGLLKDFDATSHWAVAELLPLMGARHVDRRVVVDRNRMTCAGVTAGIDLALTLVAKLRGEEVARSTQLMMEYAPEPPFHSGTPRSAGSKLVAAFRAERAAKDAKAASAAEAAGYRLGVAS